MANQEFKYFAFISYKREDEKWAKWLQYKLEHYRLPLKLRETNPKLPKVIRPIFKDTSELSAGVLAKVINEALENSKYLIVICSPRAAKSEWVCKEVQTFIDLGRAEHIIPFIIGGTPRSADSKIECFPTSLLTIPKEQELLAININEMGRDAAAIKVVSHMFSVTFDTLWQREEREKRKRKRRTATIVVSVMLAMLATIGWMCKKDWNMMKIQAKAVTELAGKLTDEGDSYTASSIVIEMMPKDVFWKIWPNRPFIPELEGALRKSTEQETTILKGTMSAVSPNGRWIASAFDGIHILLWDANNGNLVLIFEGTENDDIEAIAFSPDSRYLAYSAANSLIIRDVESGKLLHRYESIKIPDRFFSLSFSPNRKLLAVGAENGEILIFDAKTMEHLVTIEVPHEEGFGVVNYVRSLSFSANGKHLLSGTVDGVVRIWDMETFTLDKKLKGHTDQVLSVKYSPDGNRIMSASWDNYICIWDTYTGRLIKKFKNSEVYGECVNDAAYHPSGLFFTTASDDGEIKLWDKNGNFIEVLNGHTHGVQSIGFSSDGCRMVTASYDNTVRMWDFCKKWDNNERRHSHNVSSVSFSSDGKKILSSSHDKTVKIWDVATGLVQNVFEGHESWVRSAKFFPDGELIASASDDGTIRIWNCRNGECVNTLIGHEYWVWDVAFSPSGKYMASASGDNNINIWNVETGKLLNVLNGHDDMVVCVSYSKDGKHIVSSSRDATVRIWDATTGKCLKVLRGHEERVTNVRYSHNGKFIVSAGGDNIRLWDETTGECVETIDGVYSITFSDNGNKFAYTTSDNSIVIIDFYTREICRIIENFPDNISSIALSPDGDQIALATDAGTIQILSTISFKELVNNTKEKFSKRKFTSEERHKYYIE